MQGLSTDLLLQACAIYFQIAYPGGESAIPEKKRRMLQLPQGEEFADLVKKEPFLEELLQLVKDAHNNTVGYTFRLGNCKYPFMKLKIQWMGNHGVPDWLVSVETHDALLEQTKGLNTEDPLYEAQLEIRRENTRLKEVIEQAWDHEGLLTFNGLLRRSLNTNAPVDR